MVWADGRRNELWSLSASHLSSGVLCFFRVVFKAIFHRSIGEEDRDSRESLIYNQFVSSPLLDLWPTEFRFSSFAAIKEHLLIVTRRIHLNASKSEPRISSLQHLAINKWLIRYSFLNFPSHLIWWKPNTSVYITLRCYYHNRVIRDCRFQDATMNEWWGGRLVCTRNEWIGGVYVRLKQKPTEKSFTHSEAVFC